MNRLPASSGSTSRRCALLLVFTVDHRDHLPAGDDRHRPGRVPQPGQRLAGQLPRAHGRLQPAVPGVRRRQGQPAAAVLPAAPVRRGPAGAKNDYGCDPALLRGVQPRPQQPRPDHGDQASGSSDRRVRPRHDLAPIPPDAVTASASGLDPDISPANAAIQVHRVAAARNVSPAAVEALVNQYTRAGPRLPGEPGVNVLTQHRARPTPCRTAIWPAPGGTAPRRYLRVRPRAEHRRPASDCRGAVGQTL